MKKGLILEGGAMRGMFTCGVLDVFMENGIEFDGAAGISAGATFGCNYKSKQIGRAIRYNKRFCQDPRYGSFKSVLKTGDIFDADFCYHELPEKLDLFDRETFKSNPMEFYIGATDIETGKAVYHKCYDGGDLDIEWMRASASMPLVSNVVEIAGRKYLDGGIADSIPYKFMEKLGYDRNVVILTQPAEYVKKRNKLIPIMRATMGEYPKLIDSMRTRHVRYNRATAYVKQRAAEGQAFIIQPEMDLYIRRTESNPSELERVYQLGREAANRFLPEVLEFLK